MMHTPHSRGFTLLESLVAVTILALAIGGPLYAASRTIAAAQISSDRLTASYLAQEGIEEVRKLRDDAYIAAYRADRYDTSGAWDVFGNEVLQCSGTCLVDGASTPVLTSCSGNACTPLYLTDAKKYVREDTGTPSIFTRTVTIRDVGAGSKKEWSVDSKVEWEFHGSTYEVVVKSHLTAWLP